MKQDDKFAYFGSSVSSTENDINTWLAKPLTERISVIRKLDLSDKKSNFFQAEVVLIRLYGCTKWTLTKRMKKKKLDSNCTRMQRAILNKSWMQHATKQKLYDHLPVISKSIQIRRSRHAGQCWRSKDELISDVLLWTPSYGRASVGRPARTYAQQLCTDTGCSLKDLPEAMNDRDGWRDRVWETSARGTTWR